MSLPRLNPVEPPWYGPVCPVVGEGWHREVPPYPDLRPRMDVQPTTTCLQSAMLGSDLVAISWRDPDDLYEGLGVKRDVALARAAMTAA